MTLELDQHQRDTLAEILRSDLKWLRFETARADNRAFRQQLHEREHVVEELLVKLCGPGLPELKPTF